MYLTVLQNKLTKFLIYKNVILDIVNSLNFAEVLFSFILLMLQNRENKNLHVVKKIFNMVLTWIIMKIVNSKV